MLRSLRSAVVAILVVALTPEFSTAVYAQRGIPPRATWAEVLQPFSTGTNVLTTRTTPLVSNIYVTPSGVWNLRGATMWRPSNTSLTNVLYAAGNNGFLYRANAYWRLWGLPYFSAVGQTGFRISALQHLFISNPAPFPFPFPFSLFYFLFGAPISQARLFGVAGVQEDRLVQIDRLTGAGTLVGTFGTTWWGATIRDIESMTRSRNSKFLIGGTGFGFDQTPGDIFRIDPLSGDASYMGSLTHWFNGSSLQNELTGIAWSDDRFRGRLFGVLGNGPNPPTTTSTFRRGWVILIDLNTMTFRYRGDATPMGGAASGLAFIRTSN